MTDAIIKTDFGSIKFSLLPDIAPETVRNFLELAKSGFYNGTLFHRVIPGFMIQGGDPNTKNPDKSMWGQGGPGHNLKAEFSSRSHLRGIVSMARSTDPDSAGSQFFIVTSDSTILDSNIQCLEKLLTVWKLQIRLLIFLEMVMIVQSRKPKCLKLQYLNNK